MKPLPLLVVLLALRYPPASVQCDSSQVNLDGKGRSHLNQSGKNALSTGQRTRDSLSAQQSKEALDNVMNQMAKNDADMKKVMDRVNKGKLPKATKPDF